MNRIVAVAVSAVLGFSCAHREKAPEEHENKPKPQVLSKLKALGPGATEGATIVIYRNTAFGSLFGPMQFSGSLWVDDQAVGDVRDDTYNIITLNAGRHSLRVVGTVSGMMPMQSTTVVSVPSGQVQYVELRTVQEFNNASIRFEQPKNPPLNAIAADCSEGFTLDLTNGGPPSKATVKTDL